MKKKDQPLIQLIRTVELDKPSSDFTENVIDYLRHEHVLLKEAHLMKEHGLKRGILPSLPNHFTTELMQALDAVPPKKPIGAPLLSKKGHMRIIGLLGIAYIFLLLDALFFDLVYVSENAVVHKKWLQDLITVPSVFWVGLGTLLVLLLIDAFLKKKKVLLY